MKIKGIAFVLCMLLLCMPLFACGEEEDFSYSYETLASLMETAEDMREGDLVTVNRAKVYYTQNSLKTYELDAEQRAETLFKRKSGGVLDVLSMKLTKNDGSEVSIYYDDGYAYYNEDGRLFKEQTRSDMLDDETLFLFFEESEIEGYRATKNQGVITVRFTVPWSSASKKVVDLYAELSNIMQSTGMTFANVTYQDLSASFRIDEESGKLLGYTYVYTADMTVDGKKVTVEGEAICEIRADRGITITPPTLSDYE